MIVATAGFAGAERASPDGPDRLLRDRGRRTRHVRSRPGPGGPHRALERAGWSIADIERIEINEAFAAVPLAVAKELGLPEDIVNVEGGAIAHGHPIGATGAVLITRLTSIRCSATDCRAAGHPVHRRPGIAVALERPAG